MHIPNKPSGALLRVFDVSFSGKNLSTCLTDGALGTSSAYVELAYDGRCSAQCCIAGIQTSRLAFTSSSLISVGFCFGIAANQP